VTRIVPAGAIRIPKRSRQRQTVRGYWLSLTTEQALALCVMARHVGRTVDELIVKDLCLGSWTVPFHPAQPLTFEAESA